MRSSRFRWSGALLGALLIAAAPARADLNLTSSAKAQCIGGIYGFSTCEVLRFTLSIDDPQVPYNAEPPAVPGATYFDFGVSKFSLQTLNGQWNFAQLLNGTPGTWTSDVTTGSLVVVGSLANSTGSAGFPQVPLFFDVRMANFQSDLVDVSMQYGANGFATGPSQLGGDVVHAFSAGGLVSTVPEPMSMLLLGSGLAGVAGARRRRRAAEPAA